MTYRSGKERTPQYFCHKCKKAHTENSKIGKEHLEYSIKAEPSWKRL